MSFSETSKERGVYTPDEARTLMHAAGHKTKVVFDHHAERALESDLAKVAGTAAELFSNIINFKGKSA